MAKIVDPEIEMRRANRRAMGGGAGQPMGGAPTAAPASPGAQPGKLVTGYDYSGWGPQHQLGSRPAAKADWDVMTPEQRAAIGLPDWNAWKTAAKAWRSNFQPGGANFEFQTSIARDIANSGASSWDQIQNVLAQRGIFNRPEEGQALFRRLQGAFQGNMDPTGRYHKTADGQWVDVGTSDMAKRGLAGRADYSGPGMSGQQAVLAGLGMTGGKSDIMQFQEWLNSGVSSIEGVDPSTGLLFNTNPNGQKTYYDRSGYQVDPSTGQTTGHYIGGYAGGGGQRSAAPGGSGGAVPAGGSPGGGSFPGFLAGAPAPGGVRGGPSGIGGSYALSRMGGGEGGGLPLMLERGPNEGGRMIYDKMFQGGAPGNLITENPPGGANPFMPPGESGPALPPWAPPQADPYNVGAWSNPQLNALLMGQAGADLSSQNFMLDRARQEYAGAQPLESFLTRLYGQVLGAPGSGPADVADRTSWGLLAPEANRMAMDTDAALERLKQEMPVGGERAAGVADIVRQGQGQIGGLRQALQQQALGGLTGIMEGKKGFNPGPYSGAGLGMLGDLTSRRGQDVSMRGQDLDFQLGSSGQALQHLLGLLTDSTSRRGQDMDFQLGTGNQALQRELARLQAQQQGKDRKSSLWGNLLGTVGGLAGVLLSDRRSKTGSGAGFDPYLTPLGGFGTLSDEETKEQIDGYPRGLKDLKKLSVYKFKYKDDAPEMAGERHVGVMAQDLQKVAPEAVTKEEDGFLRIKPMALLAMTMNSVKELDKRLVKLSSLAEKREKK